MNMMRTLPWSSLTLAAALGLGLSGCLVTVDVANDDETSSGDGDGDPGDGDGDPGDGDGDPTGDGDGDPTGDGDGDPTGDGDGDPTGDGDGDPTGDGDGDPDACAAMDALQGDAECALPLGWAWNGEACFEILCECDGSECEDLFVDQSACEAEYAECLVSPDCEPDDAAGEGQCDAFFGYAWDGQACVGISGCSCVGTDCDALPLEPADCEAAHVDC